MGFDAKGDAPAATSDGISDGVADALIDAMIDAMPDAGPCTTTGLPCGVAVTMTMCGGQCWTYCSEPVTHDVALVRCQMWGGQLPRIEGSGDVNCSLSLQSGAAWHDLIQPVGQAIPSAGWIHETSGGIVAYTHWNGGQPNDGDGVEDGVEQCAYTQYPLGFWQDHNCGLVESVVCRR